MNQQTRVLIFTLKRSCEDSDIFTRITAESLREFADQIDYGGIRRSGTRNLADSVSLSWEHYYE